MRTTEVKERQTNEAERLFTEASDDSESGLQKAHHNWTLRVNRWCICGGQGCGHDVYFRNWHTGYGWIVDLLTGALSEVNWHEIAESLLEANCEDYGKEVSNAPR